jgi:hypothetical protein
MRNGGVFMKKNEIEKRSRIINNTNAYDDNKLQEQRSTQENKQDLDQQQQVDVKPSQINIQKIDLMVNTKLENYSGKISGVIYRSKDNVFASNANIFLYFGCVNDFPVYKTNSDENGNYFIEDLPPGFYTLKVIHNDYLGAIMHNIKVLPGQNSNCPLYLTAGALREDKKRSKY